MTKNSVKLIVKGKLRKKCVKLVKIKSYKGIDSMKISTCLLLIIFVMQLSTLINSTVFDGGGSGVLLAVHTTSFVAAIGFYAQIRSENG
ncbi:hypothetical protein CEH05_09870 [Halobacillus halophilus]|nr:hypothetical protein CEH05_09870 [Halobacillus halophilus]